MSRYQVLQHFGYVASLSRDDGCCLFSAHGANGKVALRDRRHLPNALGKVRYGKAMRDMSVFGPCRFESMASRQAMREGRARAHHRAHLRRLSFVANCTIKSV